MSVVARKEDTRNKIMMGGLIVKAGLYYLHDDNKAVLLGILLDAKEKLSDKQYMAYVKKLGDEAFKDKT